MKRLRDDDTGSTLPLTIFYFFLSITLIFIVVSATSLYLERKQLFTVADGAALVGAEAFELDQVDPTGGELKLTLRSADVARAVNEYIEDQPTERFESLRIVRAESSDGRSATVELRAMWHPPVVSALLPDGVPIEVTATARTALN
jgi:hypothetical protein